MRFVKNGRIMACSKINGKPVVNEIPGDYPEIVKVTNYIRANETDTGCFAVDISGDAWYIADSPDNKESSWQIQPMKDVKNMSHDGWEVRCLTNSGTVISAILEEYAPLDERTYDDLRDPVSLSGKYVLCADGSVYELRKHKSIKNSHSDICQLAWPLSLTADGLLMYYSRVLIPQSVSKIGPSSVLMENGKLYIVMSSGYLHYATDIPNPDQVVYMNASGTKENHYVAVLYDNGDLVITNSMGNDPIVIPDVSHVQNQPSKSEIVIKSARNVY